MFTVDIFLTTGDKDEDEAYRLTCPDEAGLLEMEKECLLAALRINSWRQAQYRSGARADTSGTRKRYEVELKACVSEDGKPPRVYVLTEPGVIPAALSQLKATLKQYVDGPCVRFYQGDPRILPPSHAPKPEVAPGAVTPWTVPQEPAQTQPPEPLPSPPATGG